MDEKFAKQFAHKPALYWIGIGNADFLYKNVKDLRERFDAKGYQYKYLETSGGHVWKNWRIYLSVFAQKLFK